MLGTKLTFIKSKTIGCADGLACLILFYWVVPTCLSVGGINAGVRTCYIHCKILYAKIANGTLVVAKEASILKVARAKIKTTTNNNDTIFAFDLMVSPFCHTSLE